MKVILLLAITLFIFWEQTFAQDAPRVFVFTDINIDAGDPDDRQSLIHLMWYADELQIEGIVPDRWEADGYQACKLVIDAYAQDFQKNSFKQKGYPAPESIQERIATDTAHAFQLFRQAASEETSPLYVLVWGNMRIFGQALEKNPDLSQNIRLITIGTGLMLEDDIPHLPKSWEKSEPCVQLNWNGFGRNAIYNDPQYDDMWWLEINWTYNGMFTGEEPKQLFSQLAEYGNLGRHMQEVVKNQSWARYFRVGDTPSVLYVIDKAHNLDDPTEASWAGQFAQPFPGKKPNYFTDQSGDIDWNYENPCETWDNHQAVKDFAKGTLEKQRGDMYDALINKLNGLY
ncbi:MAG: nucleoside hydrolase-like domain-containing protein [Bacteroidota bacterium]